ncbi:hypothetical protein GX51_01238 [Blastomyces parvus]|uniref:Extracellular membrane protein CFEM domain-containing protein n=1 Tax=Blastomyces parvus TaxID=2060905 RepID=A0A2B7XI15_9EURO|nr:hypothetical protein GX51_01238 [Blastomyces parvus]
MLRFTKISHVFVTIIIAAISVVTGADPDPRCAYYCFQFNRRIIECSGRPPDLNCCEDPRIGILARCFGIPMACNDREESEQTLAQLVEQCDKGLGFGIPPPSSVMLPPAPTPTITRKTTTASSPATASSPTTASSAESLPPGPPTVSPSVTATGIPSDSEPSNRSNGSNGSNGSDGSGRFSTAAKIAIGVAIPLVVLCVLAELLLWLRRRRKTATPSTTEAQTQSNQAHEIKPLVHEISGTEISKNNGMHSCAAELEAVDVNNRGGPTLPMPQVNPTLSLPPRNQDRNLDGGTDQISELDASAIQRDL